MTFVWSLLASLMSFFIIASGIVLIVFIFYSKRKMDKDKVQVTEANRVVIDNEIGEKKGFEISLKEDHSMTLEDFKSSLVAIEEDDDIKEVALDLDAMNLSLADVAELESYFEKLRQSKTVSAYATQLSIQDYMVALLADKIYLLNSASSEVSLVRPESKVQYYKQFLEKLGVKLHVLHVGVYKGTGEEYSLDQMSPERRESLSEIQEQTLNLYEIHVMERRGLSSRQQLVDGDWYMVSGQAALADGLIDGLVDYMDFPRNNEEKTVSLKRYFKAMPDEKKAKHQDKIVVLPLHGMISDNERNINDDTLKTQLEKVADMEDVKGVVLHIDSPGGSALESEKMYQRLKSLNLPIYASMGNVAASGGYYLSSAAQKVFATDATVTGSIGVVAMFPEFSSSFEKLGIKVEEEKQGDFSTLDSSQVLEPAVREKLESRMQAVYDEFKDRVKRARQMTDDVLEPLAGGRIYLGQRAKEINLVDEIGSLDDCIKALVDELELKDYRVETVYRKQELTSAMTASIGVSLQAISHQLQLLDLANDVSLYEGFEI